MARRSKKAQTKPRDFVIAAFAEDMEQAREYETLLKAEDIPVTIRQSESEQEEQNQGIAVLVPEDCLDEAHVVIESQDAYDDFYDFVLENEEQTGFDDDFFNDEL